MRKLLEIFLACKDQVVHVRTSHSEKMYLFFVAILKKSRILFVMWSQYVRFYKRTLMS